MVIKVVHISATTMTVSSMTIASMMTSTMMPLMVSGVSKQQCNGFIYSFIVLPTESFICYVTGLRYRLILKAVGLD